MIDKNNSGTITASELMESLGDSENDLIDMWYFILQELTSNGNQEIEINNLIDLILSKF